MIDRWRGAGATILTFKHLLGLLSEAQQSKGWDPEIACVSRAERVATKIPEMVSWLLGDRCQRKSLAKAFELDVLCTRNHFLELPLNMPTSQKTQCMSISPNLLPSFLPSAFQPLSFVEADTTYSEMKLLITCCLCRQTTGW